MIKTEARRSQNAFETRPRPSKSDLETKTRLQYYSISRHTFSATFCNDYLLWTKCKQIPYLIDKTILGEMGGVYVTYVSDVDTCKNTGVLL